MSEKNAKFRELAESRTNRAIEAIERIGKLSNRHLYEWSEAEAKKITKALRDTVAEIEGRFSTSRGKDQKKFKF